MKRIEWNDLKNQLLKSERQVCFEDVVSIMHSKGVLSDKKHPNQKDYPDQCIFIVEIHEYIYVVPYVEDDEKIFLKTIYPSRKLTKKYLKGDKS
jgi:uncharacterized DUF497 family protein